MSPLLIVLLVVAAAVLGVLALALSRPNVFRIERSTLVEAPPEAIYPLIADFKGWNRWSPFEAMDPNLRRSYAGSAQGAGALYAWEGRKAGSGRMEIVEATLSKVLIKLDFFKPFEGHNQAEFTLVPEAAGTRVSWAMFGPQTLFPGKLMSLVFNMEHNLGPTFEKGLADMKTAAEASGK
ncbi:SRPBCC family protein [Caulobacter mirabilis]|uniref:Polyketide cyclase n=1 Tax=Caulobacter mirabilis TaxID=69666 RepID=A0A2D2AZ78_9CAUL|nr:SRPBCC family protein [Caulobacter mirabilis]ATQ43237.1 polyketide cyclase [Caulobacter mirabilis]